MNNKWQRQYEGSEVVGTIETYKSRCIACGFGRGMTVYKFNYKHVEAPKPYNQIIYEKEFGVITILKEGILQDMGICNGFLSKEEMKELE